MQTPENRQRWVPFADAMRILGTSETTLRRMIRQGKVTAETEPRAPGDSRVIYRVLIDEPPDDPPSPATESESEHPPDTRQTDTTRLVDQIADLIERNTALHERIAALERENGQAVSDARHAAEAAQIERERRLEAEQELERLRARSLWKWWTW